MAYGSDDTQFILQSGIIQIGTWTNPETIGTDAVFPSSKFTGVKIGTIKRGTQLVDLPLEYIEAYEGSPQKLIRQDVINAPFMIQGEIFEWNSDTIATIMHRVTQAAYAVTTPSAKTIDLHHIGSSIDTISKHGLLIKAADVECRDVEVAMYNGIFVQDGNQMVMSGDDYATIAFNAKATPHPNFVADCETDKKNYGYIMIDRT